MVADYPKRKETPPQKKKKKRNAIPPVEAEAQETPSASSACVPGISDADGGAHSTAPNDQAPMVVPAPEGDHPHQERLPEYPWPVNACVARPVGKKEIQENPKAKAALQKEWDRLRQAGCWDETKVRSWREVAAEARQKGETHHVGRIFAICVEKNAELAEDNPARKYKGRVVFQGNQVKDENWEVAMFQELSSSPATMEASKVADCFGIAPGHVVEQADAEQAYTQSKLGGVPTWVSLPRDQWPKAWEKYDDPVCPLVLALYGHPDSGGYWERHCEAHLAEAGVRAGALLAVLLLACGPLLCSLWSMWMTSRCQAPNNQ